MSNKVDHEMENESASLSSKPYGYLLISSVDKKPCTPDWKQDMRGTRVQKAQGADHGGGWAQQKYSKVIRCIYIA
jgi:hypothetical protein